ncbi:MAG: DNA repair protein RecO [Rhodobiaceae bacterium]|nr:DNA repair protein RecO [Rhodobiaceae bacterium]
MEWTDSGFILATRRHGETSLIVEAFTPAHGRHLGLVKGGRSARLRAVLQPGNRARLTWRARLSEHLGHFTVEAEGSRAADIMLDSMALAGLNTLTALVRLLPERDPHDQLYALFEQIAAALPDRPGWLGDLARFELRILAELGFGLDLESCAATGTSEDLVYVSPKSGRAVSAAAGAPYAGRLLALPAFLAREDALPESAAALLDAFALTGFFLDRDIYGPRAISAPQSRERLLRLLREAGGGAAP